MKRKQNLINEQELLMEYETSRSGVIMTFIFLWFPKYFERNCQKRYTRYLEFIAFKNKQEEIDRSIKDSLKVVSLIAGIFLSFSVNAQGPLLPINDSISFSIIETKALVNAYVNYPIAMSRLKDKDTFIANQAKRISNDSIKLSSCDTLNEAQQILIYAQGKVINKKNKEFKLERFSKRIWQGVSAGISVVLIYVTVKNEK